MKTEKIVWGLILVFIGTILLLDNFGYIDFYWRVIWRYWPVFLIIAGVNLLFSKSKSPAGNIIIVLVTCIVLGFIGYFGINYRTLNGSRWYNNSKDIVIRRNTLKDKIFTAPFTAGTAKAELNITGGASAYTLNDSSSYLFHAAVKRSSGYYSLKKVSRSGTEVLSFIMRERDIDLGMDNSNVLIKLSQIPVWDIKVRVGAGDINFDLSKFKIQNLNFHGGAASFKVKLGQLQPITNVTAETGISSIDISVPEAAGCQIRVSSGLSSKNFKGFTEQQDGTYTTSNFNSAANKIIISLKGGVSSFEVKRY